MKNLKSFLAKNFLILAFAIGGIFAVTINVTVSANETVETEIGDNIKYCWTDWAGGVGWVTPCLNYSATNNPHYECGKTVIFTRPRGTRHQCH